MLNLIPKTNISKHAKNPSALLQKKSLRISLLFMEHQLAQQLFQVLLAIDQSMDIYPGWWFQLLWKILVSQLGLLFRIIPYIVPNHQPVSICGLIYGFWSSCSRIPKMAVSFWCGIRSAPWTSGEGGLSSQRFRKLAHLIHLEINSNNIRYVIASLTSSAKPREFRQSNSHRDIVAVRSNQVGSMER